MNSIYKIVKSLQTATGSNAKSAILEQNKDNEMLKAYLKAVMDPAISYYISKVPTVSPTGDNVDFSMGHIEGMLYHLADRTLTGKMASNWLANLSACASDDCRELIHLLISRSVGAGVGDTMILKVWPDLFFLPPYMRCSTMTPKIKKHFESLSEFIVQKKADATFGYVVKDEQDGSFICSRAGSIYPQWLTNYMLEKTLEGSRVYVGELMVYKNGYEMSRKVANGIYNSILQGAERIEFAEYDLGMEAWDLLPLEDFKAGLCKTPYSVRFEELRKQSHFAPNIAWIDSQVVTSLREAKEITSKYQLAGMEGSVYKDMSAPWKDHTSQLMVKDKVVFEAEYFVTGIYEGEGKYQGMLGGINVETSDSLLQCNCGSGFDDKQRKEFWNNPELILRKIATLSANDVSESRTSKGVKALSLPIFEEIRLDRVEADSLERVMAQLAAAKGC